MGLETGTYISDLNASNPAAGDEKEQGDDHIRLLKSTIKATFPNINGAMTATEEQLNGVHLPAAYTPTLTVVSGGSGSGTYFFVWELRGDYVVFMAEFGMAGTTVGVPFVLDITKPYGGSFLSAADLTGVVVNNAGLGGYLTNAPDTTSIRISVTPTTGSGSRICVSCTYLPR